LKVQPSSSIDAEISTTFDVTLIAPASLWHPDVLVSNGAIGMHLRR